LVFTLRKERALRVFENRVLRRIFRPNREEMAGGWISLHNESFHKFTLYQISLG
jgi:hypothetical protein